MRWQRRKYCLSPSQSDTDCGPRTEQKTWSYLSLDSFWFYFSLGVLPLRDGTTPSLNSRTWVCSTRKGKELTCIEPFCQVSSYVSLTISFSGRYHWPRYTGKKSGFQRSDNISKVTHLVKYQKFIYNAWLFYYTGLPEAHHLHALSQVLCFFIWKLSRLE